MQQITNEDCMQLMRRYPNGYFDLAIVDPPYGIGDFRNRGINKGNYNYIPKSEHVFATVEWNDTIPDKAYFDELFRVSKNQIIWGSEYYQGFIPFTGRIVWDKLNPLDSISQCDIAACSLQGRITIWRYRWAGIMRGQQEVYDKQRIHPCEKPVSLYKYLLNTYANDGDKILDTHLGSGSIAIACHDLGYQLTACEISADYYQSATNRLEEHVKENPVFGWQPAKKKTRTSQVCEQLKQHELFTT